MNDTTNADGLLITDTMSEDTNPHHLALRAMLKLNPELKAWIWAGSAWFIWDSPGWSPRVFYAVSAERPTWRVNKQTQRPCDCKLCTGSNDGSQT